MCITGLVLQVKAVVLLGNSRGSVPMNFRAISEMEFPNADRASRKGRSGITLGSGEDTSVLPVPQVQHVLDRAIVHSATHDWKVEILFPKPN